MLKQFKSLGMRSQIIIFLILVLSFVIGLISIANLIQKLVFHQTISSTSTSIILHSDLKQIGQVSSQISYYLKSRHSRSQFLIEHLAQFIYFLSTQDQKFQTKNQLDLCVTKDEFKQREYLKNIPKFCYQIHGTDDQQALYSDNESKILLLNNLSLLDHFGLLFNIYYPNMLQVVDFSNFTLDSSYPFGLILKDYDPKSQPWFINHVKTMNDQPSQFNFFSDVYQVQVNNISYQFSITQSLINKDKEVFGILNTQLRVIDQDLFNIEHNVLLLNKNGQIIYNGLDKRYNISEIFYIYNQSITGFNYTDWKQIEERAMMHKHIQQVKQFLTLYDKYSQEYVQLHCEKFEKENFTLIIYTNLSSIQMLQNQLQKIEKQFDGNFQIALFITLFSGLFLCIVCVLKEYRIHYSHILFNSSEGYCKKLNQSFKKYNKIQILKTQQQCRIYLDK